MISIPDRTQIRITNKFTVPNNAQALPNVLATAAFTNQTCVSIDPASTVSNAGQTYVIPSVGSNGASGYVGYCPDPNIPAGGSLSPVRGVVVDGFAGVTPGSRVYIDTTAADASGTNSGLTHTAPAFGVPTGVGVGWSATKIKFD